MRTVDLSGALKVSMNTSSPLGTFQQASDPGAVGAGFYWVVPSTGALSIRDATNSFWISIGSINQAQSLKFTSFRG